MLVGYLDKKLGMLDADMSYGTEINTTLMDGLKGKLKTGEEKMSKEICKICDKIKEDIEFAKQKQGEGEE